VIIILFLSLTKFTHSRLPLELRITPVHSLHSLPHARLSVESFSLEKYEQELDGNYFWEEQNKIVVVARYKRQGRLTLTLENKVLPCHSFNEQNRRRKQTEANTRSHT
jgi:hypothetical protein